MVGLIFGTLWVATSFQTPDPQQLNIGTPGSIVVHPGELVSTATGKKVQVSDIVFAATDLPFVFLGEQHDDPEHHKMQAAIIRALTDAKRSATVGFEMFTRPVQDELYAWPLGWQSEDEFIEKSDWKKQWGFDFALYRPIFEAIREKRLPMVALNVPRDWVRAVGKAGLKGLLDDQKNQLPTDIKLDNKLHRSIFDALVGGHPGTGAMADNMYSAQVLWDEGMADTALKFQSRYSQAASRVFVVVAGAGHVMYKQGINWRIERRTGQKGVTVVMINGEGPTQVSRGIADFVYMTSPPKKTNGAD